MASTSIDTPSVSESKMSSWRWSSQSSPARVRKSIPAAHSSSLSSTSRTKAWRCRTSASLICRTRGLFAAPSLARTASVIVCSFASRMVAPLAPRLPRGPAPAIVPRMRLLHTMLRVNDLEESLRFYLDVLVMKLLRRKDYESGRFTLAFVGYGDEDSTAVLELTHNWDTHSYNLGDAFGHVA